MLRRACANVMCFQRLLVWVFESELAHMGKTVYFDKVCEKVKGIGSLYLYQTLGDSIRNRDHIFIFKYDFKYDSSLESIGYRLYITTIKE